MTSSKEAASNRVLTGLFQDAAIETPLKEAIETPSNKAVETPANEGSRDFFKEGRIGSFERRLYRPLPKEAVRLLQRSCIVSSKGGYRDSFKGGCRGVSEDSLKGGCKDSFKRDTLETRLHRLLRKDAIKRFFQTSLY